MTRWTILPALAALTLIAPALSAQGNAPPAPSKPFTPEEHARYMALGKKVNTWFLEGYADSIVAIAHPDMAARMGGVEGVIGQMDQFNSRAGALLRVVDEKMTRRNGVPQFWFEADFAEFTADALVLRWLFNEEGQLVGTGMGPKGGAPADG